MSETNLIKKIPDKYSNGFEADIWSVFKIMGEFVEGYERMLKIGPCVSIFGSARIKEDSPYYKMTEDVAQKLTEVGFGVITGGGPGLMEAGNKGAKNGKGKSVGLTIRLPFEDSANQYVDKKHLIEFNYFFARKVMLVKYAQGFIVLPGGVGTLDEFFESLTLIQTGKINKFPVVLMGKEYWKGMIDWMKNTMLAEGTISKEDLDLFMLTDDPTEAVNHITSFYETHKLAPNF
jgi:uncharacterized protein (TIGR00730 family)